MHESERQRRRSVLALSLLVAATLFYTAVNLHRLGEFRSLEWDLSIFGQGTYLLSRGETPFVSIRGLHLFGDHASYVQLLLAPAFWLWRDVRALVVVQSLALFGCGLLLWREARERLEPVLALLVLAAFLLHPATQWSWLEYYEPDAIALPCLVAAYRALGSGRTRTTLLWAAGALITKENVAATVFTLGLYGLATGKRRPGAWLCLVSAAYLAVVMGFAFPHFNPGQGFTYADRFYGYYGASMNDALRWLIRPEHLLQRFTRPDGVRYLVELLAPLAFLPALAPLTLMAAAQLPLNLVGSWPYAQQIRYHYSLLVLPFLFMALARALQRLQPWRPLQRFAGAAVLACLVVAQAREPPLRDALGSGEGWPAQEAARGREGVRALLARIPPDASVSAHYRFLPHTCLRKNVYQFPDLGPKGTWPDFVLLDVDRAVKDDRERQVLDRILYEGDYEWVGTVLSKTTLFARRGPRRVPRPS